MKSLSAEALIYYDTAIAQIRALSSCDAMHTTGMYPIIAVCRLRMRREAAEHRADDDDAVLSIHETINTVVLISWYDKGRSASKAFTSCSGGARNVYWGCVE